ncbi:serine protease [Rheinheimera sp. MMS21-TC3]|uniref:S1C family serine protease n=1 Tax=Rheinheimera sp. MMS21-TC3 TaxID=3072790 RepID=UPI0028C45642|nr:serine protease [Rheinheimera sp. MMS21-TC3]WNO61265.1 serine protease [Rheinheimera sp. MMS21-TC3]
MLKLLSHLLLLCCLFSFSVKADLVQVIKDIKPAIVAIGIHNPLAAPRIRLVGTGFAIADGSKIVTNYHVISSSLNTQRNESYVVLSGNGTNIKVHSVLATKTDTDHDLAVLTIKEKLPTVTLADDKHIDEGSAIALIGYPITAVLGLYPATHTGIISAITPIAIPADSSKTIDSRALRQLKAPFLLYQLDATAYPGNSGSPLIDIKTAKVIGVVNKVFVKSTREAVLSDPSNISYAIPIHFLHALLQ